VSGLNPLSTLPLLLLELLLSLLLLLAALPLSPGNKDLAPMVSLDTSLKSMLVADGKLSPLVAVLLTTSEDLVETTTSVETASFLKLNFPNMDLPTSASEVLF